MISLHEAESEWVSPIFMKCSWPLVFNLEFMILQLSATSKPCWYSLSLTLASPHKTKAKKPTLFFPVVKNFIFNLWLVRWSFLNCEKNHPTYKNLCSLLQILFCFVNLAWSKSWYVYINKDIFTHISKSLVLVKTSTVFKYTTKINRSQLLVWDTTIIYAFS